MKKVLLLSFCFCITVTSWSQSKSYLAYFGPYNVDENKVFALNEDRKAYMTQTMFAQAQASQKDLKSLFENKSIPHKAFFVINGISFYASDSFVDSLRIIYPHIEFENISQWKYKMHTPTFMGEAENISNSRAVGAPEPGLLAVGARFMWNLGYSGKGVKVLSFDTGIIPEHPAIKRQFMGNHFPYSHVWQGYFAEEPKDKSSSHGSHTVGTMLGLYPNNNDTLGLAFNGYYMATDPIVSDLADLLPLDSIMGAYNWAFNPDGNISTIHDIPDVICNSWGWVDPPDSNLCSGYMEDLLHNIELAGIANEYSAGNDGPAAMSVGAPALISKNVVNAFSVGAIDAHNPAFPIASFSSRGPGVCGNTPALIIKPEVVAPGVGVRSCVGNNSYASYNGTSMAGPHVAGALMLLSEAFPQVNGRGLKEALYYSAIDLGPAGEDDTYGNGLIDVGAAYTFLVNMGFSPAIPVIHDIDLVLELKNSPENWACFPSHAPEYLIVNNSTIHVDSVFVEVKHNGNVVFSGIMHVNIPAFDSTSITLPNPINFVDGKNEVWCSITNFAYLERDNVNNNNTYRTQFQTPHTVPYADFLNAKSEVVNNWEIRNPDGLRTWEVLAVGGLQYSDSAVVIRFPAYISSSVGMKDDFVSPPIQLPNEDDLYVSFWAAYHKRVANQRDTVLLMIEKDCKTDFTNSIYTMTVQNAQTIDVVAPVLFVPDQEIHWKRHVVAIPNSYKNEKVYFNFRSKCYKGGSFWLGHFAVHEGEDYVSTPPVIDANNLMVYPNPANDFIHVESNNMQTLSILDMQGKVIQIQHNTTKNNKVSLSVSHLKPSVYVLKVVQDSGVKYVKFIR